jgi:tetratricopeptide (TPR) repeat protein
MMRRLAHSLFSVVMLFAASIATAAEEQAADAARPPPEIGAEVGKKINDAIELLNNNNPNGAKQAIGQLKLDALSPYERSRVEQILAAIDNSAENYAGAAKHLEQALAAGGLTAEEALQVRFQTAQLLLAQEKWKDGAAALEEWFAVADKPNAAAYYMLAMAYYQQDDFKRALTPAEKAVNAGDQPQPAWVQLLLALYLNLERWDKAIPLITLQIRKDPQDKASWQQLVSVYAQQQQYERALVITQLMEYAGLLVDADEYVRLVDQMMYAKLNYRAASLLARLIEQKKVKSDAALEQKLGTAWLAAREYEKAVTPFERALGMSGDANLAVRIAEIHLQRSDWPAAEAAVARALANGGLQDAAAAELSLGIALYNQNKLDDARHAFERAARSPSQREYARSYLSAIATRQAAQ